MPEPLPTERVRGYIYSAVDILLRGRPETEKQELVHSLIAYLDNYRWEHGLRGGYDDNMWTYCDSRIKMAANNEGLTYEQLAQYSDAELLRIPNFGRASLNRLRAMFPNPPARPR